ILVKLFISEIVHTEDSFLLKLYYKFNFATEPDEAWIVTNSFYTKSAVELGNACSIIMKDRNTLSKWIININPDFSNNEKCPRCNHELVVRTGKNGQFLGCSNYPNCKYTKNI
ncbi:topoisomerase DNA-binding C4 zinc finger domain-containing protein, partial [Staphylococcus ureilyticus]|uniref:topoisomerase DNA-binding C4 zinc finger domain-containing protein n=1 Tax=Staphylococcus ureilyticus TaxID=94138 RepID=UPI0037944363